MILKMRCRRCTPRGAVLGPRRSPAKPVPPREAAGVASSREYPRPRAAPLMAESLSLSACGLALLSLAACQAALDGGRAGWPDPDSPPPARGHRWRGMAAACPGVAYAKTPEALRASRRFLGPGLSALPATLWIAGAVCRAPASGLGRVALTPTVLCRTEVGHGTQRLWWNHIISTTIWLWHAAGQVAYRRTSRCLGIQRWWAKERRRLSAVVSLPSASGRQQPRLRLRRRHVLVGSNIWQTTRLRLFR